MSSRHRPPAKEFAEGASRVKDVAARASGQSMPAGIEMVQRNGEIVQHTIQSSAKPASTMAECSADQFGRLFDFSSRRYERSSRNMETVVQSGTIVTDTMQRRCVCGDIARARIERRLNAWGR
jgi:hypothetical protein